MEYVKFTDEEKIKMFDEIAARFYNQNFGLLSKNEYELMMFRFYLQKMISDNSFEDGTIDYSRCTDYKISKDLGITQQRVKNLKIKNQLTHPIEYDWKKAFAKLTENARYDKITKKVTLYIPDPNLYIEIQNYIEESGAYIEKQLNGKVLQLRVEYYIDLIVAMEPEINRRKIAKVLKAFFQEKSDEDNVFDEKELGKSILNMALNVTDVMANLSDILSPENMLGIAFLNLIKNK